MNTPLLLMCCCIVLVGILSSVDVELKASVGLLDWSPTASLLTYPSTVKTEGWQVLSTCLHAMVMFIAPILSPV